MKMKEMKRQMGAMERTLLEQNQQMKIIMSEQSAQIDFVMNTLTLQDEEDEIAHGNTTRQVAGVSFRHPDPDHAYSPDLASSATGPFEWPNEKSFRQSSPDTMRKKSTWSGLFEACLA